MKISWSQKSQRDLLAIIDFISQDAPLRAVAFGERLRKRIQRLAKFPLSGRTVPELRHENLPPRELLIENYRALYRIIRARIEIITIFHGKKQFPFDIT